ncbi:hypothetical protein [Caballeronia sp. ATUFL_M2_KS44]|uniref:hypothetical protein n=1 Tax=Caballeronia sp. ATUFL_M2_KS44 TaxID=2921767 RepID=UPI002028E603|nr:hypothetical protein [Caballeronia sp. ATUFL_M2_KS44]
MTGHAIAILNTGLVTSVGLSAPATCAAIRAKISNPTETRFIGSDGEWIMAHQVQLEKPWRGRTKLAKMAAMAIAECLEGVDREAWRHIPLLLCVAEANRPGRIDGLDRELFSQIEAELQARFCSASTVFAMGRAGVVAALAKARQLTSQGDVRWVVVAATDSLLNGRTLREFDLQERILTESNSDAFMPGEAAGALLIDPCATGEGLNCIGVGFAKERAAVNSHEALRGEGLTTAVRAALMDSGLTMEDISLRVTDIAGEQYYFKEAALTVARTLRKAKARLDIWHPAECIGEVGAAQGTVVIATALAACQKGYTGGNILAHLSNDDGLRASAVLQYGAS